MAKNLTVEQKLEILKAHGVSAELYSRAAYKVLNYQNIFDIFTIGNAIGRCTMEVSESYAFDKDCLGYIYFVCIDEPWHCNGIQSIAREIGNENVASVSFKDEDKYKDYIGTIFYKDE